MDLTNKKILVTGASGFIGSTLVEKLIKKNNYVVGFDNFNTFYSGKEQNIENLKTNTNFEFVQGDILDLELLKKIMKDVDIVFHLAAQPGVRFSLENPIITNKINCEGTINALEAAKFCNVKRLINASSSSVYGNVEYMPTDENHRLNPVSIYGVSKLAAEKYCSLYSKLHNLYVVSLRYHSVYGPRGRPDMAVFKWIDALFHDKTITIYGDGNQTRDMTFVDDIVHGTMNSAEIENINGEIFNIASGRTVTMNYVLNKLIELTQKNTTIVYEDFRIDDAKDTHGNIEKAKQYLNYNPEIDIDKGLKITVDWYKKFFSN